MLLGLGGLALRSARYEEGLSYAKRALQLDTYDAEANFLAGNLYRALDMEADARDAFGWAARSVAFRAAAYVQLAEIMAGAGDWDEAERYAELAIESDRYSVPAWQLLAVAGRRTGDGASAERARSELLAIDPLHHFALSERYLAGPGSGRQGALIDGMRSEYPGQSLLELAIGYANLGLDDDALALLELAEEVGGGPLSTAWRAYLQRDASTLGAPSGDDLAFVFPFRTETLPVLRWAVEQNDHWSWRYLLGLNLWALDRDDEAAATLAALRDQPDYGPAYAARGYLLAARGGDQGLDLQRAVEFDPDDRILRVALIRYLQGERRWAGALQESARAREIFPGDFNLALLHAMSLLHLGEYGEAIDVLANTHVLPSENARESHRLHELAHVGAALSELDDGDHQAARDYLEAGLLWPESLGQGRPYDPDERLVRFVLGAAAQAAGDRAVAREAFGAIAATVPDPVATPATMGDLVAIAASAALGHNSAGVLNDAIAGFVSGQPEDSWRSNALLEWRFIMRALELAERGAG